MAEVKWIKIVTDVFDDEKILMIETMPDADSIIVIWFKLLCLAGKQNNSGVFMMGRMPYTDEMFSTIFRRPINTVRLALNVFEQFGMIEIINGTVAIPNWDRHQSLDALEKKKERDRLYQRERRAVQKAIAEKSSDKSCDICDSSLDCSFDVASQIRLDKIRQEGEGEREEDIDSSATPSPKTPRHKYGLYNNVLLSDEEYGKLIDEFPNDYEDRIERLSEYIASTGKTYKSHLATIRAWSRKDKPADSSNNPFLDMLKNGG